MNIVTAAHRIYVPEFKSYGKQFGEEIVLTLMESPDYRRLVAGGYRFRIVMLLCYWVGGVWAEVLYEFENLSDEDMVLLALRENLIFNPDLDEEKVNDVPMGTFKVANNDPTYFWKKSEYIRDWEN